MNIFAWSEIQIFTFFLILVRVSSLILFFPIFGHATVPANVKVLLCVSMAWVLFPILWNSGFRVPAPLTADSGILAMSIVQEVLFGLLIGFVSRWIFEACQSAGQLVGASMGLSMASVLDPNSETQTLAISELKTVLVTLFFLAADGHHLLLRIMERSFIDVPIGKIAFFAHTDKTLVELANISAEILKLSIRISAPVMAVVFLVNITFGLVSRAVPQINVFAVSFGANILVGLFVFMISIPSFSNIVSDVLQNYAAFIIRFMGLLHG